MKRSQKTTNEQNFLDLCNATAAWYPSYLCFLRLFSCRSFLPASISLRSPLGRPNTTIFIPKNETNESTSYNSIPPSPQKCVKITLQKQHPPSTPTDPSPQDLPQDPHLRQVHVARRRAEQMLLDVRTFQELLRSKARANGEHPMLAF